MKLNYAPGMHVLAMVASGVDRQYASLELVAAQGTAISATISALTAVAGDQLQIRNTGSVNPARLLQAWCDVQVAGTARIRSPRMHDNVQGMRFDTIVSDPTPFFPKGIAQPVYPNEVIAVELAGSAVAGDIEYVCMLLHYPDMQGSSLQGITAADLKNRIANIFTVENTLATTTAGGWTGAEAINAEFDQFKAGNKYALLGYRVDAECAAVAWRGAETGNVRVGGPGLETDVNLTQRWFIDLAEEFGLPLIPVFSAENKSGILIDCLQDENGADVTVTSIFAELRA
jgi:hypothetical protein